MNHIAQKTISRASAMRALIVCLVALVLGIAAMPVASFDAREVYECRFACVPKEEAAEERPFCSAHLPWAS